MLPWVIDGLIPSPSVVVLWGPPKEGKTLLALQTAVAVAQGGSFVGNPATRGNVLLLELDTSEAVLRKMLRTIRASGTSLDGGVFLPHPDALASAYPLRLDKPESRAFVQRAVLASRPSLVVVDCLRELGEHDEDKSGENMRIISMLKTLTVFNPDHPCSCLLLHHTRKFKHDEVPDPISAGRGSSYLAGAVDSIWFLKQHVLHVHPRFDHAHQYRLTQGDGGWWQYTP